MVSLIFLPSQSKVGSLAASTGGSEIFLRVIESATPQSDGQCIAISERLNIEKDPAAAGSR